MLRVQKRQMGHAIPAQMHGVYSGDAGIKMLQALVEGLLYSNTIENVFRLALSVAEARTGSGGKP